MGKGNVKHIAKWSHCYNSGPRTHFLKILYLSAKKQKRRVNFYDRTFSQDKWQVYKKQCSVKFGYIRMCYPLGLIPLGHNFIAGIWRNCPAFSTKQNTICLQYVSVFQLPKYIIDFQQINCWNWSKFLDHFLDHFPTNQLLELGLQLLPQSRREQVHISNAPSFKV